MWKALGGSALQLTTAADASWAMEQVATITICTTSPIEPRASVDCI